ncbi:hypothetical protein NSQ14_14420 [Caldifermentibacillus hisashii]|uniref:hypothetical protein n=1 Tax=Caldifermentibacillus hisashii TaxID=996558 RepID=UPI0031FD0EC6
MATRTSFVVKKWGFPAQNGDENEFRRQNCAFSNSKWRRERGSSPKNGVFWLKMVTRFGFVVKIALFPTRNGDEIEARRQKMGFSNSKW